MAERTPSSRLTREQKTGFVLLLTFGIVAVGMGALQMRNTIYGPFAFEPGTAAKTTADLLEDETVRLQSIDTDHDTINDYEELYFYQTSPYLPDTDSDGVSDKAEIDTGANPLCAEGELCEDTTLFASGDNTNTIDASVFGNPNEPVMPTSLLDTLNNANQDTIIDVEPVTTDVAQIRALLLQTGKLTQEQLDGIPDDQLLAIVNELVSAQDADESAPPSTTPATVVPASP